MSGHGRNTTEEPHEEEGEGGEHGEDEEEHGDEEGEHGEEEHHIAHYIIWPSTFGMMIFITLVGYLFYHFYSRYTGIVLNLY